MNAVDVVGLRALAEKALRDQDRFVVEGWFERDGEVIDGSYIREDLAAALRQSLPLLDEITTLRAEVADRDADDQRRSEEGRTDWDYEHKIARAEAALTARDRGMCKARFSDEDPVECWLLAGHDGDHIVDGGAYMWTDIETRLRQAEAALADRDARIAAAKRFLTNASETSEMRNRDAYGALSVPAVPVPQDNPEPPTDDERVSQLMAYVTPLGYSAALSLVNAQTEMLKEQRRRPALHELRELGSALVSDEAQDNPEATRAAVIHLLFDQVPEDWDENDIGILTDAILAAFDVRQKEQP